MYVLLYIYVIVSARTCRFCFVLFQFFLVRLFSLYSFFRIIGLLPGTFFKVSNAKISFAFPLLLLLFQPLWFFLFVLSEDAYAAVEYDDDDDDEEEEEEGLCRVVLLPLPPLRRCACGFTVCTIFPRM